MVFGALGLTCTLVPLYRLGPGGRPIILGGTGLAVYGDDPLEGTRPIIMFPGLGEAELFACMMGWFILGVVFTEPEH